MLTSFGSGEIWKGSNQEISVVLVPRCYKVEGEITDVVINFYTTAGGTSIEFSGDTVTVSGINATVVFQPVQLDALDDGLIRYNVAFNEGGESHVFDLETRYMLKTPNDYEPVDYVTHAEVEGVVDELLVEKLEDYYTSGETNEAISNAMAAETARTEQTYLKQDILADYYTSAQTDTAIQNAISGIDLSDYWTSAQTESAITEATSGIVKTLNISTATSGECMEFYNYAMSHHNENYIFLYHFDGDDGFAQTTEVTFDGNGGGIYLVFFTRGGKYVFSLWQGGTGISIFGEENFVTTNQKATTNDLGLIKVGSGLTIDSGGTLSTDIKEIHFVVVTTGDTRQAAIYAEIKSAITNNYFDASKYRFYASFKFEDYNEYIEQEIKIYGWEQSDTGRIFFNLLIGNNQSERDLQLYSKKWYLFANGKFSESAKIKKDLQFKLTAGAGIEITSANTINCTVTGGTVPVATTGSTGVVQVGSGLTIDSAGTLNNGVISVFIDEKQGSQAYYKAIYDFVRANSGDTSLVIYYANANLDRWYECLWYQCNENHFIFTFYDFDNSRIVSNIISNNGGYGNNRTDNIVMKPNSSEYSPFNKKLHLSSGGTLYFDDTEVDSGGTYNGILNIWGMLILVGAYQFINTHTGPFDTMLCPLYVDSSSTDSGRTLMYPKVIDEPANVSIPGKEIADHKVTLVYDEYKISWYQRGSQDWITGLSVTPNSGGSGLAVYDFEVITGDSTARAELIDIVSGGTQTAVVVKDGVMYYYRGYDEGEFKYVFVDYKNVILHDQPQHSNRFYFRAIKVDANQAYQDWFEQDISFDVQQWMYTTDYYSKQSVSTNGFLYASDNTYDVIPGSTPKVGETYTNIYFTIPGMLWTSNGLTVTVNGDSHEISWWGGKEWNVDGNVYNENHTTEAGMTVDFSHIDGTGHGYIGISAAAMTVTQVPENGEGGGTSVSVPILATTNLQMYRNGEWNSISAIPNLVYSGASQGILASAVSTVKAGLYNGAYAGNDTFYILIDDLSQEAQSILYESVSGVSETVTLKAADYTAVIVKTISSGVYSLTITENPSADLSDYWTSAQTQSAITDAISGIDLGDYYTSAQTDNKIAEAVSAVTFSGVTQPILDATMAAETARTEQTYLKQGALADYYTSGETNEAISNAIAAETARTESTYLKEHQSLDNYYTKAQTDSAITNAIDTESARTNTAIANAIAAETARTEQTYLKEHQSLADYYTSAQTNSAITTAVQDKVGSATITQIWTGTQAQYNAMSAHTNNILYFING